jgi:ion channel-forming bestrophin family protein
MIEYNPHKWTEHILDIRGSLIREISLRVLLCGLWSFGLICVFRNPAQFEWMRSLVGFTPLDLCADPTIHSMIGFAFGLLLVFRTNSSYDRFWEGRKLWGGMVNETRNLARLACVHLAANTSLRNEIVRAAIAFVYASKHKLRGSQSLGPMAKRLNQADVSHLEQAEHPPLAIAKYISVLLRRGQEANLYSDLVMMQIDQNVQLLIDYIGACERIHKTPMPYAYMVHIRRAMILYLYSLPFAIYLKFGWLTLPASLFVAFIFFGIEEIGVEIEDPFEGEENDLPLEAICSTIDKNLSALIGDLPSAGELESPST